MFVGKPEQVGRHQLVADDIDPCQGSQDQPVDACPAVRNLHPAGPAMALTVALDRGKQQPLGLRDVDLGLTSLGIMGLEISALQ
ncbi:DUF2958 domain-containing protein [Aminobacter sp. UC22_36]|uniref:DUF2958 domain-containing protein n=1 Tax=Aminobacter sp. UC22_36 TaxID=3374549 RepID=UPI0037578DC8